MSFAKDAMATQSFASLARQAYAAYGPQIAAQAREAASSAANAAAQYAEAQAQAQIAKIQAQAAQAQVPPLAREILPMVAAPVAAPAPPVAAPAPPPPVIVYPDPTPPSGVSGGKMLVGILIALVVILVVAGIIVGVVLVLRARAKREEIFLVHFNTIAPNIPPGGKIKTSDIIAFLTKQNWRFASYNEFVEAKNQHSAQWCYLGYFDPDLIGLRIKVGAPQQYVYAECGDGIPRTVHISEDGTIDVGGPGTNNFVVGVIAYGKKPSLADAKSANLNLEYFTHGRIAPGGKSFTRWSMYDSL